jgi:hypothetical protein
VPDADLLATDDAFTRFAAEVTPEAMAAVLLDPLMRAECTSYDDDLIDEDRKYSIRAATDENVARLTIMRVISDPQQSYRFHHFEARETSTGAVHVVLLTQEALGERYEPEPVPPSESNHYVDALSCFRRLREFLAASHGWAREAREG